MTEKPNPGTKSKDGKKDLLRYLVKVNLSSARRTGEVKKGKREYYFEVGKKRRQRTPTNGYFEFNFDRMTDIKEPINLYTEFFRAEEGREIEVILAWKEKNDNPFKLDDSTATMKLSLSVGDKRQAYTLNDEDLELRVHISIVKSDL